MISSNATSKTATIEIVDMLGKVVFSDIATVDNGTINKNITLGNNAANGIYLLRIKTSDENQVSRFTLDR